MHTFFKHYRIAILTTGVVLVLVALKLVLHAFSFEFLSLNTLITSAIGSVIFITGFLLAGIIADYKEAERIPGEIRAALENILEESRIFALDHPEYDHAKLRERIGAIIRAFFAGVRYNTESNLSPCLALIDELSDSLREMGQLGMMPNFLVRLKTEQGIVRRAVLRVSHIQRTQFIPSAHILAETLIGLVILVLLLLRTEGSPESIVVFAFLSYLFIYIGWLISVIEQPFREGADSRDDVSLFLLRELEARVR